jgi:hypothetical protein
MRSLTHALPLILSTATATACYTSPGSGDAHGDGSDTGTGTDTGETAGAVVLPSGTSVFLEVVTPDGESVSRATVTIYMRDLGDPDLGTPPTVKAVERFTDGAGHLLAEDLAYGKFVARVDAPGHAPASVVLNLEDGVHAGTRVVMLPLAPPIVFQADEGASLAHGAVRVDIPREAVVDADGHAVTGLIEATLTPVDPSKGAREMPWPLAGVRSDAAGGASVWLRSLYMADISLWQDGKHLQLAPGKTARVEFMLPEMLGSRRLDQVYGVGDEVPGWTYDYAEGVWREEAAGRVIPVAGQPGRLAWSVEVEHFSPRNADDFPPVQCVLVSLFDDLGDPIVGGNVVVEAGGTFQEGITGADGQVCLGAPIGGVATVYAGTKGNPISEEYEVQVDGPAAACGSDGCVSLGVHLEDDKAPQCSPGDLVVCPYSGSPDQLDIGICTAATDFCGVDAHWLGCAGEVLPGVEQCDTPAIDEDCDTVPDEQPVAMCMCQNGDVTPCFPFDGVVLQGACAAGQQTCIGGAWDMACVGVQGPVAEDCTTLNIDEDCDGNPGCGDAAWGSSGLGDGGAQTIVDVAVDGQGGVYITGFFSGQIDFGGAVIVNDMPTPAVFVAKYGGDAFQGVVDLGVGWTHELDLAASPNGGIVLAATRTDAMLALDACPEVAAGDADVVLVRFDADLKCLKRLRVTSPGPQFATAIDIADTATFVAGLYTGTPDFGDGQLLAPDSGQDAFVACFDGDLQIQWSEALPVGLPLDDLRGPAVAASAGDVVVAGVFAGTPVYAGDAYIPDGPSDILLIRRNGGDGGLQWVEQFGNNADEPGLLSLAAAPGGDLVLSGVIDGVAAFGVDASLVGAKDKRSVFVARLDFAAAHRWSVSHVMLDPAAVQGGQSLAVDDAGRAVLVGTEDDGEGGDIYLWKFSPQGAEQWQHTLGGPGAQRGAAIAASPDNGLYVVGSFEQDFSVDGQMQLVDEVGDAGDGFLLRLNP